LQWLAFYLARQEEVGGNHPPELTKTSEVSLKKEVSTVTASTQATSQQEIIPFPLFTDMEKCLDTV
jgi:hypothetical protein